MPMTAHKRRQIEALRGYLDRHCVGWERRYTIRHVRNGLARLGFPMAEATVQRLTKPLRLAGVLICSDDTPRTGGIYIATCRREVDETIAQLDARIDGLLETRNCLRKLRDERFPQRELCFAGTGGPDAARGRMG